MWEGVQSFIWYVSMLTGVRPARERVKLSVCYYKHVHCDTCRSTVRHFMGDMSKLTQVVLYKIYFTHVYTETCSTLQIFILHVSACDSCLTVNFVPQVPTLTVLILHIFSVHVDTCRAEQVFIVHVDTLPHAVL